MRGSPKDRAALDGLLTLDRLALADACWLQKLAEAPGATTTRPSGAPTAFVSNQAPAASYAATPTYDAPAAPEPGSNQEALRTPIRPSAPSRNDAAASLAPGLQARMGALRALPERSAFRSALRLFQVRDARPSGKLDEAATVDRLLGSSDTLVLPVMHRGSRRWLSLSLVVEASPSNALWSQSVDEFEELARQQGIFRRIAQWRWTGGPDGEITLLGRHGAFGAPPRRLSATRFRRHELVLVVSDFTAHAWWSGALTPVLARLANEQPLVLLHTLPQRLWHRSWVGKADALASAPIRAAPSAALEVRTRASHAQFASRNRTTVPVIPFRAAAVARLARMLTVPGSVPVPVLFPAMRPGSAPGPGASCDLAPDPAALVHNYNMASSSLARRLAQYMAVTAPITFPIMRWVQAAMLSESDSSHLAEFVLGGLLRKESQGNETPADDVVYAFPPGIAEQLQHGMPIARAIEVLQTVGTYLEANQHGTMDKHTGITTFAPEAIDALPSPVAAFAMVSDAFLRRIGLAPAPTVPPAPTPVPNRVTNRSAAGARKLAEHARTLSLPLIDIKWSPTDESLLAILHDGGIEVWDVLAQQKGTLIASIAVDGTVHGRAQPLMLYWFAGDRPGAARQPDPRIQTVLQVLWNDLVSAGFGPVCVEPIRLPSPQDVPTAPRQPGVLLLFENDAWAADVGEDLERQFGEDWLGVGVVRLDDQARRIENVTVRADLSLSALDTSSPPATGSGPLEPVMLGFRRNISWSKWFGAHDRPGMTAICWGENGALAIARRERDGSAIDLINAQAVSQGGPATSLHGYPRAYSNTCLLQLGALVSADPAAARGSDPAANVPWAWIDENGASWISGVEQHTAHGPCEAMLDSSSLDLAATGPGLAVTLISKQLGGAAPSTIMLQASNEHSTTSGRAFPYPKERILALSQHGGILRAITSSARLHAWPRHTYSSLSENSGATPVDGIAALGGTVIAACFVQNGDALCLLRPDGVLELWNTENTSRIDRLEGAIDVPDLAGKTAVLCAAPNGQLLCLGYGQELRVYRVLETGKGLIFARPEADFGTTILWVDDRPDNNFSERIQLKAAGAQFMLAETTNGALDLMDKFQFAAVISDMGRREGPQEGYALLKAMRANNNLTPFFIYAGSNSKAHRKQALMQGAQGSTNRTQDLLDLILPVLRRPAQNAGEGPVLA